MRKLLIQLIGTAIAFYLTSHFVAGFHLLDTWQAYLTASFIFILINTFAKPILNLILLPINLLTLGLFHWLINVIILYLFDILYNGLTISAYNFPGYQSPLLALPPMHLSLFWVLVISSFLISLFYSLYETIIQ